MGRRVSLNARLALVVGILIAGLVLSTGELGCPDGYVLARGELYGTCIGVDDGQMVTTQPRVVWH